jgi:hypothetical protein
VRRAGRPCSVCASPRREAIESAIVAGSGFRAVSRRFEIGRHALQRHARTHLRHELAAAEEKRQEERGAQAGTLLDRLGGINGDARRILTKAERAADFRAAVGAVRELRGLLELEGRLLGELRPAGTSVAVGVSVEAPPLLTDLLTPEQQAGIHAECIASVASPPLIREIAQRLIGIADWQERMAARAALKPAEDPETPS